MTASLRFARITSSFLSSGAFLAPGVLAVALMLQAPVALAAKQIPIDQGILRDAHEALGFSEFFGRWDQTVRLVYDPDGAPAGYTDNAHLLALIEEAFAPWEQVSGIQFEITDTDATALDDRDFNNPSQRDGLVRISWDNIGGAAGQAGPIGQAYDSELGYFPYDEGTVELNKGSGVIDSDFELVTVLIHEFGHLIGLGHSDNPNSVMYANPYNFLRYPRADDIRAVQVLYGNPATAVDPDSPVAAWVYTVPPAASSTVTQFLFKPNSVDNTSAHLEVNDSTITSVTSATPDEEFVMLYSGGFGNGSSGTAIDIDTTVIVVDPAGYVYGRSDWKLECPAGFNCGERGIGVLQTEAVKTMPGNWKIHVVDESTGASNARLLLTATLPVTTTATFNHGPTATLTAVAGAGPAQATFTLTATDPEGDDIAVVWHPLGSFENVTNTFLSGGSASRTFNFTLAGTHTFYVEVNDDSVRYNSEASGYSVAGEGFQTLLKVTVTLPVTSAASLQVVSTQEASASTSPSPAVLTAVATTPAVNLRARSTATAADVATGAVSFKLGASSDQGATTKTTFTTGDSVIISGSVSPQTADVGQAANIYVLISTTVAGVDSWKYRTVVNGTVVFVAWDGTVAGLQPAATVSSLQASEAFEVYSGPLIAATHRVFIGYRLSGGTTLFYTGNAMTLTVN